MGGIRFPQGEELLSMRLFTFSIVILSGLAGCKKPAASGPPGGFPTQVVAVEALREPLTESLSIVGTVQADEMVEIKAQIGGIVLKINFEEGQKVEAGQSLVEIDAGKIAAQLSQAEANLRLAQSKFERSKELALTRAVSVQELDESRAAFDGMRAAVELIKEQLKDTRIVAPFSGTMGARHVSPGQVIDRQVMLTSLVRLDPVKVEGNVPERYLGQLKLGQKFALTIAAFPNETFDGEVYFIAPQVDPVNRTTIVKARVANPDGRLKPGMFASAEVTLKVKEDALVIPEAALMPQGERTMIFTVDKELTAQMVPVRTGLRVAGRVEILEGLKGGETVVVEGWQKMRPGGKVKLAGVEKAAAYTSAAKTK